jgi:manganese-dependent inorganic pyrophosphatase
LSEQQEETRPTVLVVGHRNPDTDSIAAAVGLAELRSQTDPAREWVPRRLGDLTPQTAWVLEQSGVEAPPFLADALPQVVDVMRREFPVVSHEESIRDAGALLVAENLEVLPVVDDSGVLVGVLTEERLARRYVRESREPSRLLAPTTIAALVESTTGELVAGDEAHRVTGRVWVLAMDVDSMLTKVGEGDVVVVGDREDVQLRAVEGGVGVVVLGNGVRPTEAVLAAARERGTNIICSPLDSYVAARLITLASPCRSLVDPEPLTVRRAAT